MAGKITGHYSTLLFAIVLVVVVGAIVVRSIRAPRAEQASASIESESAKANQFFEDAFQELMMRDPMFQTRLGIKTDYDKWRNLSKQHADETMEITKRLLADLEQTIDYDKLDRATRLSYDLFVDDSRRRMAMDKYRYYDYPVNQMFGWHSQVASFLINFHRMTSAEDAKAYIARLQNVPALLDQVVDGLETRAEIGVIPPKFVFSRTIPVAQNIISGAPFDDGDDSTIFKDFKSKVDELDLSGVEKQELTASASDALVASVKPAFEKLIAYLTDLETQATTDDGVWKFPDGDGYYKLRLAQMTTTDLTAQQIHDIGLAEVKRIHDETQAIMDAVGFDGSLQDFFAFMREDDRFYFEDTPEGKQAYLDQATQIIDNMRDRLDELFITKPKAAMVVKAVEPFREASAGGAFYQRPSPDGTRPGVYYANLYKMENMPIYEMEALAYHEGIPGHHMQLSIAMELEDVPTFRKYLRYTAYTEGWGLYSEMVPKEIGLYEDPYSDFGRLSMELWRACRLVVDTGIHDQRWTRDKAIQYLQENTPGARDECVKAIERYIVYPGQATAYKIGMLKIIELREKAKDALGDRFDIREYHDLILASGPVPLSVLEQLVDEWIAKKNA